MDKKLLEKAVDILERDGLVAIPTETVYGLAADAENAEAVAKIYAAKKRPTNHPLIVHVYDAETAQSWVKTIPEDARKLMDAFWPGPLTIVLPRSEKAKDFITGGQDSVALRCPSHPYIRELLCAYKGQSHRGLAAPSANSFGKISPTTAEHVRQDLGEKPEGKVDLILDGGPCSVGIESTILDLSGSQPRILREGAVTAEMIEKVIQKKVLHGSVLTSPRVSGSLKSHYAPNHPLRLVNEEDLAGKCQELARHFKNFGLIAPNKIEKRFRNVCVKSFAYEPEDPSTLQPFLYEWLHELDSEKLDVILVVPPPERQDWLGVLDRLSRAAAGASHE